VRIVIFIKLLVSWGNYLDMVIIRRFSGLMSSNFLEIRCKSFEPQLELELT